ncbi:MAG TPA: hypothetical protein VFW65_17035 [Pseudonocardiaceae bacterium]|nr:hypothetical protein [Pseudonocardiaceae bacterium]
MNARIHRLTGLVRSLGWGRNALRRRTDRIEAAVVIGAIVLTLAAVPAALAIGTRVHRHYLSVSATQTAAERHVTATLLDPSDTLPLGSPESTVPVRARWTQPPGVGHVGIVQAAESTSAGSHVRIWTNPAGTPMDPPLSVDQARNRGGFAILAAMLAVVSLLGSMIAIVRMRLNRIRYAAWSDEWQHVGPRWTQRRNSP